MEGCRNSQKRNEKYKNLMKFTKIHIFELIFETLFIFLKKYGYFKNFDKI
jgi:hypothetical protein